MDGRFEVRGTLGTGGAGVVYRAFDKQLQREVALKLLRTASGRDLYRFKREFRALADIVHPNLVTLHELHANGGEWYFTMELVEDARAAGLPARQLTAFAAWPKPDRKADDARLLIRTLARTPPKRIAATKVPRTWALKQLEAWLAGRFG